MGGAPLKNVRDEDVRGELERILSSPEFETSERNRRFLRHVVEETLGGRADRIKAYSIATRVFGRGDDFDPVLDSIVRIEAARLRRALEHYYLKHGEPTALRISIPKGTYVPEFAAGGQRADPAPSGADVADGRPLHRRVPRIMVDGFDQEGYLDHFPTIGRTLTRQVIAALTRFTELFVYGFDTTERLDEARHAAQARELAIDYCLAGTATISPRTLRADLLMKRTEDARYVWVQSIERPLGEEPDPARIVGLCDEIAGEVARVVGLRDGIMDSQARDYSGDAPTRFGDYQKLLDFHDYWRSHSARCTRNWRRRSRARSSTSTRVAGRGPARGAAASDHRRPRPPHLRASCSLLVPRDRPQDEGEASTCAEWRCLGAVCRTESNNSRSAPLPCAIANRA